MKHMFKNITADIQYIIMRNKNYTILNVLRLKVTVAQWQIQF